MKLAILSFAFCALLAGSPAPAQSSCKGAPLTGIIVDPSGAVIPGAAVSLDASNKVESGSDGRFRFPCIVDGTHRLHIAAQSFAEKELTIRLPLHRPLSAVLQPETVETTLDINTADVDVNSAGATQTISGKRLQSLAEDPDELLQQLQQMAAGGGGNPANTTISVDGFQNSTQLPPKSSIAYIKLNPDLFSAEYRDPPLEGARVEVYTRPGAKLYHGALFVTDANPWMNARDPFSVSRAAIGRQLFGFELTGPITRKDSSFSLNLEHRSIDDFGVVNAITLDSSGTPVQTIENVATPQRRWVGMARMDWQLGAKNTFIANYTEDVSHLQNVGAGGNSLPETGYDSFQYQHVLRFINVTTLSAKTMHEARLSFEWDGNDDTPSSSAPQVSVAGAFTGGGANAGPQRIHRVVIEADDDAILTAGNHLLKFGTQLLFYDEHNRLTQSFNGAYTFGGGIAPVLDAHNLPIPGQTTVITGLEQYRRALLAIPGGAPTAYSAVTGTPITNFTHTEDAFFFQDDWKLRSRLHLALGMRYYLQTNPNVYNGATPRFGVSWSPDKKATWNLHGHVGLFAGRYSPSDERELLRMDGVHRLTSTVYNPVYGDPFSGGAPTISSYRTINPHLANLTYSIENVGVTKSLPGGWNLSADFYLARIWNYARTVNINSPLNGSPTGPRPFAPSVNILEMQNSGQGGGDAQFFTLEQHSLKHVQFYVGIIRINILDDTSDDELATPQSSTSDVGEIARRPGNPLWRVMSNATFQLPAKLEWSSNLRSSGDAPYNVTTGFDNNGDGNFNDRPQYAPSGTPLCSVNPNASPCGYATDWGELVNSGGIGSLPRDKGIIPWQVYLDTNLQRTFSLTRNAKADHPQTLTANIRSSNVLNHRNVTGVGGVLGSPQFGVPYIAGTGRRIEAGLRYSF